VLLLDIVSKTIVVATLSSRPPERLLGGLLTLVETRNPGAAFNLGGPSETIIFSLIAIGVAVFIIRAAHRIYSIAWAVALGLLLGGATGNLTDRIFRSPGLFRGWVVDWIELPHWPVFNLADSAITCGGVLMVVLALLGRGIEGRPRPSAVAAGGSAGQAGQPQQAAVAADDAQPEPQSPTAEQAPSQLPRTDRPTADGPGTEQPLDEPPATEQPPPEQPAPDAPPDVEQALGEPPAAEQPPPEQPAPDEPVPEDAGTEPSATPDAVPQEAGTEEPMTHQAQSGQSQPEQPEAESAQPESAQPEWPDPDQPRSKWPRPGWSEPEQPRHEHPARDSGG
jgi:signal peptidase II